MAIADIKHSVGKGGRNQHADVLVVQILLNGFIIPGMLPGPVLVQDGIAGKNTKQAIKAFQAFFLGFKAPDGRVDPGGKTITALNGPLDQPRWGDPHETTVQSVIATLRGAAIRAVRFQLDSYAVSPADYEQVAKQFSWRRLQAYYEPGKGANAEYYHTNGDGSGGHMLLGFPSTVTATQKSTVVHEATHAVCDGWARPMFGYQAEAIGHLAQGIYYYEATARHFSIGHAATADVLSHCVNIAIRMKSSGNRTVTVSERDELYRRVKKLPTVKEGHGFYYDGF